MTIEKTVEGAIGETDKAFAFTLELTPSGNGVGVDGTYDATLYTADTAQAVTITVTDGMADFTLMHGQRLVIHEIPAGATYAVSEESYALEGYQTSASSETGTIPATGSMPVASFTNTRNVGGLTVTKKTAGNGLEEGYPNTLETYTITVNFIAPTGVTLTGTWTQGEKSGEHGHGGHVEAQEGGAEEAHQEEDRHALGEHDVEQQRHTEGGEDVAGEREAVGHPGGDRVDDLLDEVGAGIDGDEDGHEVHQSVEHVAPDDVQVKRLLELALVDEASVLWLKAASTMRMARPSA